VAGQIIDGEQFKPEALAGLISGLETIENARYCRPPADRGGAVIRLRTVEDAISAGEQPLIDPGLQDLDRSLRHSLACSPADPFLWLVLFWVENMRNGYKPENLALLKMSYRLGPNEAWIGLKRVSLALALLRQLPAELADSVVLEFMGLVNSGYYFQMASIFPRLDPEVSKLISGRSKTISLRNRELFAKELYRRGYNPSIPGIAPIEPRPWH
jgi:hypothetical protein